MIRYKGCKNLELGKNKNLFLKNVLVVTKITTNVLSISNLTYLFPYSFEFFGNDFVDKDHRTNKVIARARGIMDCID